MDAEILQLSEEKIEGISGAHRPWVLPLLTALEAAGGSAQPKHVKTAVWDLVGEQLSEGQVAYLKAKKRLGWVRWVLKRSGFLTGEPGTWELTDLARSYLDAHRNDPISFPTDTPELGEQEDPDSGGSTETVQVTNQPAFEIPLLEALEAGLSEKQKVLDRVHDRMRDHLLPGDTRIMRGGARVWRYRASWALTRLRSAGVARNVGVGLWEITDAGRRRLEKDRDSWDPAVHQTAKATVRALTIEPPPVDGVGPGPDPDSKLPDWSPASWENARKRIPSEIFSALSTRLRPDLGPVPRNPLSRNVVLYGPPGTGKTFIAAEVARSLTGQPEPGPDSLWRLVQFHPSYAYEDFIQGLRPDLENDELRYKLSRGPFLDLCEEASSDPDHFYVVIIDEINRGDPARIFGELLYALEYRDEPVDLALGGQLTIPRNVVIIGTMNSVDRSVALVDYALRRRFGFIRVSADPQLITDIRGAEAAASVAAQALHDLNEWISQRLDVEHTIGHSFFLNRSIDLHKVEDLWRVWDLDLRPLLEEYFFGDSDSLSEATKCWRQAIAQAELDAEEEEAEDDSETAAGS